MHGSGTGGPVMALLERIRGLRPADVLISSGYELTDAGRDLLTVLGPVDEWAKRWARRLTPRRQT